MNYLIIEARTLKYLFIRLWKRINLGRAALLRIVNLAFKITIQLVEFICITHTIFFSINLPVVHLPHLIKDILLQSRN